MIDSAEFVQLVREVVRQETPSGGRAARLGTVDAGYTTGAPRVTLDGTATLSPDGFPRLTSYTPAASDRVLLLPIGNGYVIAGKVS